MIDLTPSNHSDVKPPVNYVFVDYENVHDVDLTLIGSKFFHFTLLVGARQTRLEVALVEKMLAHPSAVQLVRLQSSGENALDFVLAYYLGKAALADPTGNFHIISKDAGFDPLIEHLRSRHIHVRRHVDYTSLSFSHPAKPVPAPTQPEDLLTRVVTHLRKNINNRPKRKKTLVSHLHAVCGSPTDRSAVDHLIQKLSSAGHLAIDSNEAVTYYFDSK